MMNNSLFPSARTKGLVVQEVPNEVLVYDLETDKAHCLNETAAAVWRACDGNRSVREIADSVGLMLGKELSDDLVWLAIDQLNEHGLLQRNVTTKFNGQSRREALKKIGIASMVALPIIASLAAPKSVLASTSCTCNLGPGPSGDLQCQAQTGCGATCGTNSFCQ
ncbi:MAG: PqqD family protein [Pyrinomonadaceae bacterium]